MGRGAPLATTTLNSPPHDTDLSLSLATVCLLSGASSVCLGLSLFHGFVVAGIGCIGHISVRPVPGLSRPPGHPQVRRGRSVQQLLGGFVFIAKGCICTTYFFWARFDFFFLQEEELFFYFVSTVGWDQFPFLVGASSPARPHQCTASWMDVPPATLLLDLAKAARKGHRDLLNLVHSCWCLNFTGVRCQTLRNWSAKRSAPTGRKVASLITVVCQGGRKIAVILIAFGGTGVVIRWLHFFEDSSF